MAAPKGNTNAKKLRTRTPVVLSIGDERLNWVIAQLGIDDPTDAQIIRFVKDFCYSKINSEVKKMNNSRKFVYEEISTNDLIASDLLAEAQNIPDAQAYLITLVKDDGYHVTNTECPQALYSPGLGRMGIAWGADATWADVDDLTSGINMYLNDGEEWNARN